VKKSKINLSRITTSGNFIPEIDGLRFVAIVSVVLFHLFGFIENKDGSVYNNTYNFDFIANFLKNGNFGVQLFFVLSGFILGLPFAKHYLKDSNKVSLKSYFLRRISRLEPPYVIVMFLLLIGNIFISKNLSNTEGFQSFLASVAYMHNFIYAEPSLINTVAWSLEIEIQFYILAPILSLFFSINNNLTRRFLLIFTIIVFSVFSLLVTLPFLSILDYLQYFLVGFLLVDFYLIEGVTNKTSILRNSFTIIALLLIFSSNEKYFDSFFLKIIWNISVLILIFSSYYNIILRKSIRFFSLKTITNIGGMCYTIYLIHFSIISFVGNPLLSLQFSDNPIINIGLYSIFIISSILLISIVFFILIEKPCMDKNWPNKVKNYVRRFITAN
tara:strand:- start:3783 stop:4940 length:1158 start_codon:yes stop_codon:yes gene_type:complete